MKNYLYLLMFIFLFGSCVSESPKQVQVSFEYFHSADAGPVNSKKGLRKSLERKNWKHLEKIEISKGGSNFIKLKIKKEDNPYILMYEKEGRLIEKKLSIETKQQAIDMLLLFYTNTDFFKLKYQVF